MFDVGKLILKIKQPITRYKIFGWVNLKTQKTKKNRARFRIFGFKMATEGALSAKFLI